MNRPNFFRYVFPSSGYRATSTSATIWLKKTLPPPKYTRFFWNILPPTTALDNVIVKPARPDSTTRRAAAARLKSAFSRIKGLKEAGGALTKQKRKWDPKVRWITLPWLRMPFWELLFFFLWWLWLWSKKILMKGINNYWWWFQRYWDIFVPKLRGSGFELDGCAYFRSWVVISTTNYREELGPFLLGDDVTDVYKQAPCAIFGHSYFLSSWSPPKPCNIGSKGM